MTQQASPRRVLVTVSGTIADDLQAAIDSGRRPRVDYIEMQRAFHADLLDYTEATKRHRFGGRIIHRALGRDAGLAWECFRARRRYDVIVTDGEQIGLPLSALLSFTPRGRRSRHIMIVHILSVPKKVLLYRMLRLGRRIDEMVVYASAQRDFVVQRLRFPRDRVTMSNFMVDTSFFSPDAIVQNTVPARPMICSAGLEFRDYPTLIEAVRGLDIDVVLAAASPWSKRKNELEGADLPSNVRVVRLDLAQLRELYTQASIVVLPLRQVDFQAGVTTLLEAMSMAKPVICTRTLGQTDVIIDAQTGIYVPPSDADALRGALTTLLADADMRSRLGAAGRQWVVQQAHIDVYVEHLRTRVQHQLDAVS